MKQRNRPLTLGETAPVTIFRCGGSAAALDETMFAFVWGLPFIRKERPAVPSDAYFKVGRLPGRLCLLNQ